MGPESPRKPTPPWSAARGGETPSLGTAGLGHRQPAEEAETRCGNLSHGQMPGERGCGGRGAAVPAGGLGWSRRGVKRVAGPCCRTTAEPHGLGNGGVHAAP